MANRNAVLLVDKGQDITSFDCLSRIKRTINRKTGHCGTLDKFAHGLLVVLCGCYTHMVPAFMGLDKTYEAVIEFGKMTATLDPEGEVLETAPVPDEETVRKAVSKMVGNIMQVPPVYSAIHVNGKRSYQMARDGETDPGLKAREVVIHEAEILNWEAPFLTVRLHVSKGTYVRSYARDLGHECGSCAYVKSLYRTKIGPFSVEEAFRYDDMEAMALPGDPEELLSRLPGCVSLELSEEEAFKAANGYVMPSAKKRIPSDASFAMLRSDGRTVCIYSVSDRRIMCQVRDGE